MLDRRSLRDPRPRTVGQRRAPTRRRLPGGILRRALAGAIMALAPAAATMIASSAARAFRRFSRSHYGTC